METARKGKENMECKKHKRGSVPRNLQFKLYCHALDCGLPEAGKTHRIISALRLRLALVHSPWTRLSWLAPSRPNKLRGGTISLVKPISKPYRLSINRRGVPQALSLLMSFPAALHYCSATLPWVCLVSLPPVMGPSWLPPHLDRLDGVWVGVIRTGPQSVVG